METQVTTKINPLLAERAAQLDERASIGRSFPLEFAEQVSSELYDIFFEWLQHSEDIPEDMKRVIETSYTLLYLVNLSKYGELAKMNYASLAECLIEGINYLQAKKGKIGD